MLDGFELVGSARSVYIVASVWFSETSIFSEETETLIFVECSPINT